MTDPIYGSFGHHDAGRIASSTFSNPDAKHPSRNWQNRTQFRAGRVWWAAYIAAVLTFALAGNANAAPPEYVLRLHNHTFDQSVLKVPAGTRFALKIVNADATSEEFDSDDLHVEKIIKGNGSITLTIGPLAKGSYQFFGDFHRKSAQGTVLVEDGQ